MDFDPGIKVCRSCAEPIKAAAKVCPFCRTSQTRFGLWLPRLGVCGSVLAMLTVIGLACYVLFPEAFHSDGRRFTPYRAQLRVERTSLERDPNKPEFWLTGFITNSGDYPWRICELEVRFMAGGNKLVDVRDSGVAEKFVIQPRQERAFRVPLGKLVFTNGDTVPRVRVQTATDGNFPIKQD